MNTQNHSNKKANKLINESSPYLLQHAYNPVNWQPWGEEALAEAKKEDKLMIISIGYAACHWCHVMEHESFEDSLVASIMNENFVPVKVDREERPDVDDVYMTAAHLVNGRGGWPLNAIALPDGRPIFAGTYYPKDQWIDILTQISQLKEENPEKLKESAQKITEGITSSNIIAVNEDEFSHSQDELVSFVDRTIQTFDRKYGGRMGAPKFPMPNSYEFLMKYYWHTGKNNALETVEIGLDNMAKGGIYDQLGGGFARYSTDEFWLAPHFEKMLYDNGQLVSVYADAYKITKSPLYKNVIEETLEFVDRELTSKEGGFYSSLDADSEGVEGKFYVWSESEIDSLITDTDAANLFKDYYDVSKKGNWEHTNILNVRKGIDQFAKDKKMSVTDVASSIDKSKAILMKERDKRIRPGLDDKVLTSWNALMMTGYIDAFAALGNKEYLDRALTNANFIVNKQMQPDGRLNRNYKDGVSSINAFLDDYALTINALVKLYQVTFDKQWLDQALKLEAYCVEHFYNDETKMYDYTSDLDPPLIAKKAEYTDNVIPASNSSMARSLFALGTLTYNKDYLDKSKQMLNNMLPQMTESTYLSFYSNWYQLLLDHIKPPYEIAVIGPDAQTISQNLSKHYLANSLILGSNGDENMELLTDKFQEGQTTIYVCQNKACKLPVTDVDKALKLILP
ncbi:thioredoxin domain-containing protein [Saprospiraceae bacterium]|nr:thioredoxin domain-containing protein [Saprospiraceae bacterium]